MRFAKQNLSRLPNSALLQELRTICNAIAATLLSAMLVSCSEPKWGSVDIACTSGISDINQFSEACRSQPETIAAPRLALSETGQASGRKKAGAVSTDADEDDKPGSIPDVSQDAAAKSLSTNVKLASVRLSEAEAARTGGKVDLTLPSAASVAVTDHPEVKVQKTRIDETNAAIGIAVSALYPSGTSNLGVGGSSNATGVGSSGPFQGSVKGNDGRVDGAVTLRQLVYDFGATQFDIERAKLANEAERLKTFEKFDDIAFRTTQSYVKVLENRDLLKLIEETLAAHRGLAEIVQANVKEGNGTNADVSRIASRINDLGAIRTDLSLAMLSAQEDLRRFTRREPGRLSSPISYRNAIPLTPEAAIATAVRDNPRLRAVDASTGSIEKEIEFQKASNYPKLSVELSGDTKNYQRYNHNNNEAEARAMLSLQYKFADGGLNAATVSQLSARREGSVMTYRNEREQIEADIRQAYRAIKSAQLKSRLVQEGVVTAAKVQELYVEQFKANRRTVFEVLDSQMSSYTSRRSLIESRYDEQIAIFSILKATGRLTLVLTAEPPRARKVAAVKVTTVKVESAE